MDEENDDEESDIPQALPLSFKGHSRVQSEFQSLKFLGKGGFGEVLSMFCRCSGTSNPTLHHLTARVPSMNGDMKCVE